MPFWYHGTTKESADTILRDGFKEGTYFAQGMDSALVMGGEYIFWVWFDENPTEYWEYVTRKPMGTEMIACLIKAVPEVLYESEEVEKHIHMINFGERHGKDIKFCEKCKGRGQLEKVGRFTRWRDNKKVTICPVCGGFGCLRKDGGKVNESDDKEQVAQMIEEKA